MLGKYRYIDLTHTLSENSPVYPGKTCFQRTIRASYEGGYRADDMQLATGVGTHLDAPSHFYRELSSADEISIEKLFATACVMNLAEKVLENGDYLITAQDIENWESTHGKITKHSIFLAYTGWSKHWPEKKYVNLDSSGICHFPGFDRSAAELLRERQVHGVGIDTLGIDRGCATQFDAHEVLLKNNIFLLENLASLDQLPPTKSILVVLPMKIKDAPEAPIRVIGMVKMAE